MEASQQEKRRWRVGVHGRNVWRETEIGRVREKGGEKSIGREREVAREKWGKGGRKGWRRGG